MADLLVTSMMADGGLETAFEASLLGEYCLFLWFHHSFKVHFSFQLKQMISK